MDYFFTEAKAVLAHLLPAIFGAALSIFTNKEKTEILIKVCTFVFGVAVAYYIGYGFVEWVNVKTDSRGGAAIVFSIGYFGLNGLKITLEHLPQILTAIRVKFLGS